MILSYLSYSGKFFFSLAIIAVETIAPTIIANKYDKISVNNREKTLKNITNILKLNEDDKIIYFSSVNKKGRDEVGKVIAEYLK